MQQEHMNRTPDLTPDELNRYSRQTILPEVGVAGQKKLRSARVLVVGAGGLGSPASLYLAAAGVGKIGLADADAVDASNLQRQIIHGTSDIGKEKTRSAADRLREVNPHVKTFTHQIRLDETNIDEILGQYDVALGCVDNFATRYILDAACVRGRKPHIYGSINQFEGQASVFAVPGPCYRCFFQDPPPPGWRPVPEENGVLGSVAGLIGCVQANETIKVILGAGTTLAGRLLLFNALTMKFREISIKRNPACPVCGITKTTEGNLE